MQSGRLSNRFCLIILFSPAFGLLVGSDIDHKVKAAAAQTETAWDGIGQEEGLRIWRIENFQVKPWPKDQYGEFFRGDSYIVLKTYKEKGGNALKHDIHIWIGSESSQDEYGTAAYKMVEADEYLGGVPVQHRQVEGKESSEFVRYFPTLEYLDGGVASGFNKVEPTIENPLFFCVKGTKASTLKMNQMPLSITSMNEGDSFILYASKGKVWCWHGKEVSRKEVFSSRLLHCLFSNPVCESILRNRTARLVPLRKLRLMLGRKRCVLLELSSH